MPTIVGFCGSGNSSPVGFSSKPCTQRDGLLRRIAQIDNLERQSVNIKVMKNWRGKVIKMHNIYAPIQLHDYYKHSDLNFPGNISDDGHLVSRVQGLSLGEGHLQYILSPEHHAI